MSIHALTLSNTKLISTYLVPSATLVIGGVLVWKLWQQRQQLKENQQVQDSLSERLDQLETQKANTSTQKKTDTTTSSTTTSFKTSSASTNSSKQGLFEQLISDNIALREAH